MEYPEFVEKLLLLCNAGLTIRNALQKIIEDYSKTHTKKSYLMAELEYALNKIKSGYSESDVYAEFGRRCKLHSYIKLASLLQQNLKRGSADLKTELQIEIHEAFLAHKNLILQTGEKTTTKMLFPMILILIVVIGIIMIPSFLSMSNL